MDGGAARRRYSSMTAEESSTDQLHFVFTGEEATSTTSCTSEEDEHSLMCEQAHPSPAPHALDQREKERRIEWALQRWGGGGERGERGERGRGEAGEEGAERRGTRRTASGPVGRRIETAV